MTARVVSVLITLFLIATVSMPVAIWNKLLFGVLVLIAVMRLVSAPADTRLRSWSPLVIMLVFMYGLVLAFGGHADLGLARQLVLSVALLLLIYPVLWYDVDLDRAIKVTGVALSILTFVFLGAVLTSPFSPSSARLTELFMTYSLSSAHERSVLGDPVFMVRLGSSHFLLVPFALLLRDLRARWSGATALALVVVIAAMLASTSRGLVLIAVFAAGLVLAERMSVTKRVAWALVAAPALLVGLALVATMTTAFSATEMSNAIKLGHATSFVENLSPASIVFGDGLAAYYYSSGLGRQVSQTEITLLDMLRYFGFILAPVMFIALLFPSWRLQRYVGDRERLQGLGIFALYLIMSFTNPVLFNSMGLSVVLWYWWRVLRTDEERTERGPSPPMPTSVPTALPVRSG